MDYKITGESLIKALKIGRDSDSSCVRWHELCDLLEKLLVPVEDAEGWVGHVDYYQKKEVKLYWYGGLPFAYWRIFKGDEYITDSANRLTLKEAQSWADAEIARYEAGKEAEQKHCPKCNFLLPKDYSFELCGLCRPKPKPKPFGVGSRLRAANGDEIEIIGYDDPGKEGAAYNRTIHKMIWFNGLLWFFLDDLKTKLLDSGAEVIG